MNINNQIYFWLAWIIIPLIIEIIPSIGNVIILFKKFIKESKIQDTDYAFKPEITIIVPVYNSADTLYKCIKSINDSTYPNSRISVLLVDNGSKDNSFDIFQKCQLNFPGLSMFWMSSNQGKSRALNEALYNSPGKYIINIDSDGRLEKNAISNVIKKFENHPDIACLTGAILTEQNEIEETKNKLLKFVRRMEYVEYCQAFLAGRNYYSDKNAIFTISGAFSAFKKSAILQSFLYSTSTICEDAHMTFQIRNKSSRVALCNNAIFFVSPIDDFNKLYTQRQRWQIGELEVFHMFFSNDCSFKTAVKNPILRNMIFDHTFAFPRMIWYFALIILSFNVFSPKSIALALGMTFGLYMMNNFLYYVIIKRFIKSFETDYKYYKKKVIYVLLLPFYSLYIFILRFMGIINSLTRPSSWKTYNFGEEMKLAKDNLLDSFRLREEKNE